MNDDDVVWVVNDNAELGVEVGGRVFFLYKGRSMQYMDGLHDDGTPMMYRRVGKREFGECALPWAIIEGGRCPPRYLEGDGWIRLPVNGC